MQNLWLIFVGTTALCWGCYGPSIHEGTLGLKSAWKAFLFVGGSYFVLAVLAPLVVMKVSTESLTFTGEGSGRGIAFALVAGAFGAMGALGIIAAMRTGGKPIYVMPLVFGLAPLVNVVASAALHPPKGSISPGFWIGLVLLAAGASLVLYCKPS